MMLPSTLASLPTHPRLLAETFITDLPPEYQPVAVESNETVLGIVLVGGALVAAVFLLQWAMNRQPAAVPTDPLALELFRNHRLTRRERRFLSEVSLASQTTTAAMFLSPAMFDQAVWQANQLDPRGRWRRRWGGTATQLELRRRLFVNDR